ncbi:unnamed protein product, partial [Prorocentrum cordatum]
AEYTYELVGQINYLCGRHSTVSAARCKVRGDLGRDVIDYTLAFSGGYEARWMSRSRLSPSEFALNLGLSWRRSFRATAKVTPAKRSQTLDGVLSESQKCIIKALFGGKCKLPEGSYKEVSDSIAQSWSSNPTVVKTPNSFLKDNFDGDPPRAKKERIQCFWDVLQQLYRVDDVIFPEDSDYEDYFAQLGQLPFVIIVGLFRRSTIEALARLINYEATELFLRGARGVERASENAEQRSDWKPPNGAKQGWKSRVNFTVLEELDSSESDQEGAFIDGVKNELRERLAHRALLAKSLYKPNDHKNSATKMAVRGRASAALRSLRALATGQHDQFRDIAWGGAKERATCRELPGGIAERVLECHREAHDLKMQASDAESAFERLALRAKAGAREATAASDDDELTPPRGKVMPFVGGEASLPPAGAEPCDIMLVSPKARYDFDRFYKKMALPRARTGTWPAWDARRVSKRFRPPPRLNLGPPMAMSEFDLSDEVTQGRALKSTWGDVPDFFHSFAQVAFVHLVFMGDFASLTPVGKGAIAMVETVQESSRTKLKDVGLDMHKGGAGGAMHLSLGATIAERSNDLTASREKIQNVIGATGALLARRRATSNELSRVVGSWAWLAMCCRSGFCVLDARCKLVTERSDDDAKYESWGSVLNELHMLHHRAPLMHAHREARWGAIALATDASEQGLGVVETNASRNEVKEEVDRQWKEVRSACQRELLFADNARNPRRDLMGPSFVELVSEESGPTRTIYVLEMRAAAYVARHLCRSSLCWFSRFLVLCDSMVTVGAVRRSKTKAEQKKVVLDDEHPFERLLGDQMEIMGMRDDCARDWHLLGVLLVSTIWCDGSPIGSASQGALVGDVDEWRDGAADGGDEGAGCSDGASLMMGDVEALKSSKKGAAKKGPTAFETAAAEKPINRSSFGTDKLERPLRRPPFAALGGRDITVAAELDNRASQNWDKYRQTWEARPASIEAIFVIAREAVRRIHAGEAAACPLACDCRLPGQDWLRLRAEGVRASCRDPRGPWSITVAILLGRRRRGESVKTSLGQGVAVDNLGIAAMSAKLVEAPSGRSRSMPPPP